MTMDKDGAKKVMLDLASHKVDPEFKRPSPVLIGLSVNLLGIESAYSHYKANERVLLKGDTVDDEEEEEGEEEEEEEEEVEVEEDDDSAF